MELQGQIDLAEGLTKEQIHKFNEDGYLLLPGELDKHQLEALINQSRKLLEEFPIESHPLTKFTTGDSAGGDSHIGDAYFLNSSDKVSFFFENDAFDKSGNLIKPKTRAINKIGHFLHELDPVFKAYSLTPRNAAIARSLGFHDPRILQSMVICKQPEIGGAVPPHQDGVFLYTKPQTAVGWWYALEDCTAENGPLEFVKGSHKTCDINKRFVRKQPGNAEFSGTTFENLTDAKPFNEPSESDFVTETCPRGTLVLINHSVVHKSAKNLSQASRYAYAFHVIDGQAEYDDKNWLQIPVSGGHNFTKLVS